MHGRTYYREPSRVALLTTPGTDAHTHVAVFDDAGTGYTSEAPDGHWHGVVLCDVLPAQGHTHELTTERRPVEGEGATEARHRRSPRDSRRAERKEAAA